MRSLFRDKRIAFNRFYNGLGSFIGIGTGAGGEIHTGWSDTNNVFVFNIFKLLDKIKS